MNINDIIKKNKHLSYKELSKLTKITTECVRKRYRRLGLPPKKYTKTTKHVWMEVEKTKESFVRYLERAKTLEEITTIFKNRGKEFLSMEWPGYDLFTQRDDYNRLRYILLPKFSDKIEIKPKTWTFRKGKDEHGKEQPYLLIQLPEFKGKLQIALLFDVHYGNAAHKEDKFRSYINWIKNNPNVYAILGGDLMENAIDRGMTHDQTENPQTQLNDMAKMLAPIAHKILGATTGNHEERTRRVAGFDPTMQLCQILEVPYFSGPFVMSVMANTFKWNFYVFHGFGNSQTKGGKMNMASRPKGWTNLIHFFVSGHVHDRVCESEDCIVEDPINCRLRYVKQWTVVAPAFLDWYSTYAYRAGYKVQSSGGVSIELLENGDYKASLT